jgi:uncharacterized protein YndB with AHSA1/START domain
MSQPNPRPMAAEPPPVIHGSFSVERIYRHPAELVFFAHADVATTRRWRVEGEGFEILEHEMDFRVDGAEVARFRYGDGPVIRMDSQFQAIEPDRRIVFTYRMAIGEAPMSVSLATIEITPVDGGSKLTFTEQGAYFGDPAAVASREEGTRGLLESLAAELDRTA